MITEEDIKRFAEDHKKPEQDTPEKAPPKTLSSLWLQYWWELFKNIGGKQ